jgi:hypothetical protein
MKTPIAYDIGKHVAKTLIEWDLYESPRQAFELAKSDMFQYNLSNDEYLDFKDGVIAHFNSVTIKQIA